MMTVEEWAEIRRLHFAEKKPIKAIVRETGIARNTVRGAIRSPEPPSYRRRPAGSKLDPYKGEIHLLLKDGEDIPARRVFEICRDFGYEGSETIVRDYVRQVRPLYKSERIFQRTTYFPGEIGQWDLWEPPDPVSVGFGHRRRAYVVVGVLGYSRKGAGALVFSKTAPDLLWGIDRGLARFEGAPRTMVFDREGALCRDKTAPRPRPTDPLARYAGAVGFGVHFRPRRDPQGKGLVERLAGYLETSFLPGRSFCSPGDFQGQLDGWFDETANVRVHRTLRCRPEDRWAEERGLLLPLPEVRPDTTFRKLVPVLPDPYVRFDTCDYSIHPAAVGKMVEIRVGQERLVAVTKDGVVVGDHPRSFAPHRTITHPAHGRAIRQWRESRGAHPQAEPEVEVRDLARYDELVDPGLRVHLPPENGSGGLPAPRFRREGPR